jgi:hypothetical protein
MEALDERGRERAKQRLGIKAIADKDFVKLVRGILKFRETDKGRRKQMFIALLIRQNREIQPRIEK